MSDTNADPDGDEPSKAELHDRVQQLESTVEKLMPSRRDALKLGAAGIAGAAGLSATTQPADAATGSAGQIGDVNNRPDVFADTVDTNNLTGVSTGGDRQGCRVFLDTDQSISSGSFQKITFGSKVYDSDNNFDTSTHNWTCPKDGLYMVRLQAQFKSGGSGFRREIRIGSGSASETAGEGAQVRKTAQARDNYILSVSTINKYQSNDTIAGYAFSGTTDKLDDDTAPTERTILEVAFLGSL